MDFAFTPEQDKLREDVRQFLAEELGPDYLAVDQWGSGISQQFSKKLSQRGWLGMTWPKEYGGRGMSYLDKLVVTEELLRVGAPCGYHWIPDRQTGPALIKFGTDEQKRKFLPGIINAEHCWCALFSEPNAGSDLSSARTTADEVGDEFVVNGQKIWTSEGHISDFGWLLAVTDRNVGRKHLGLSELIVDMRSPGITIRPIVDMSGEHHFNEVFFDNVRVPRGMLVGEKNRGWYQIAAQLDYERSGIERVMSNWPLFTALIRYVKETKRHGVPLAANPVIREQLADLRVGLEAGRLLAYRVAWMLSYGKVPNYESAMAKAYGTTFEQHFANVAMKILGPAGVLKPGVPRAPLRGQAAHSYLRAPSFSLRGGTSEVLRGIIALRGLGLPAS